MVSDVDVFEYYMSGGIRRFFGYIHHITIHIDHTQMQEIQICIWNCEYEYKHANCNYTKHKAAKYNKTQQNTLTLVHTAGPAAGSLFPLGMIPPRGYYYHLRYY
jgi:hypothetical protein